MKKFVAGSIGTLMMSAGLVASAGTAAHADPYPGTVATTTVVTAAPAKVKKNKKATICATTTVKTGTGKPTGTLTIKVTRNANSSVKLNVSVAYAGGQVCVKTGKLKKVGGYVASAQYTSKAGTVFNDSAGSAGFDVVKKKK